MLLCDWALIRKWGCAWSWVLGQAWDGDVAKDGAEDGTVAREK